MQKVAVDGGKGKSQSFLSRITTQGRNYSSLVAWLVYTVFKGRTRLLTISIGLNLVSLASQAVAIYIIYWYAKEMEGGGKATLPYLDLKLDLTSHPEWLWMAVALSALAFIISAALMYFSRQLVLDVAEQHYGKSMEKIVLDLRRLPDPRAKLASRLITDFGMGGLSTGARRGALIATSFATAIAAVIGAAGAAVFLIRIDPSLTLLILVSIVLAALFLYPLTLRAVAGARAREKAMFAFKTETKRLFEGRNAENPPQSVPAAMELARCFMLRRRVLNEFVFAIEIGATIILSVVVFYMASQAFSGREQWAIFIAYIGALRIALAGASAAIQVFASVSRFYPRIVRYSLFVKDVEKMDELPLARIERGDTVILGMLPNGEEIVTKAGQRLALLTIDPVPRVMYALINAHSPQATLPIGITVIDSVGVSPIDGGIALVYLNPHEEPEQRLQALAGTLEDKVTLVTYFSTEKVGTCGEEYLLTCSDTEFRRFVRLGTPEAEAAIQEIAQLARKRKFYEDEEDEDE